MPDLLPFLKQLVSISGLSGYEEPARRLLIETWSPLVDEISLSKLGSLHALRRGKGSEPRPRLLIAAHMDSIGMMVRALDNGFLRLTNIGGLDPRVLPGQLVMVHGREDLPGLIVQPPAALLPPDIEDNAVPLEHLLVDTGLLPEQVAKLVRVGDTVSFDQLPLETADGTLAGHSLDNRASLAALTVCLEALQGRPHLWDVWAVATTQEEVGLVGAYTSAFQIQPQLAITVDVTHAESPDSPKYKTFPMGKGPVLGWGPNNHPVLFDTFKELAERLEIPYNIEPMPRLSGTDAVALQVVAEGIPSVVLSIPLRYMHTPVEMVALKDIERAGRLLAEFVSGLDAGFMERLAWNE